MFDPRMVVLNIDEFSEMSAWLGQRYEDIWMQSPGNLPGPGISQALLLRKLVPLGEQSLARRYVV
jgi:hypothetical protein